VKEIKAGVQTRHPKKQLNIQFLIGKNSAHGICAAPCPSIRTTRYIFAIQILVASNLHKWKRDETFQKNEEANGN
jgi:hypothetical protein